MVKVTKVSARQNPSQGGLSHSFLLEVEYRIGKEVSVESWFVKVPSSLASWSELVSLSPLKAAWREAAAMTERGARRRAYSVAARVANKGVEQGVSLHVLKSALLTNPCWRDS